MIVSKQEFMFQCLVHVDRAEGCACAAAQSRKSVYANLRYDCGQDAERQCNFIVLHRRMIVCIAGLCDNLFGAKIRNLLVFFQVASQNSNPVYSEQPFAIVDFLV